MDVSKKVHGRLHSAALGAFEERKKGMMMELRWLLPFTHGVDMRAIDFVVRLAESHGATLVPVSLISVPGEPRSRGARLEHIQQSKDFLEAVQYKAARLHVAVERYEVFTSDVIQSIRTLIHNLRCDAFVMVAIEKQEVLLRAHELKRLLVEPPESFLLIRLPARTEGVHAWRLGAWFLSWLHRLWGHQDDSNHVQDAPEEEESSWIGTEERHQGYSSL
jgi:hypothetical protein